VTIRGASARREVFRDKVSAHLHRIGVREGVKRPLTFGIAGRHSKTPACPCQAFTSKANPSAVAEPNRDHLIAEPVRRVQKVPGFGQKDKLVRKVAVADHLLARRHITERAIRGSCSHSWVGTETGRMVSQQSRPVKNLLPFSRRLHRSKVGEIRPHAAANDCQRRGQSRHEHDGHDQEKCSSLLSARKRTLPSCPDSHQTKLSAHGRLINRFSTGGRAPAADGLVATVGGNKTARPRCSRRNSPLTGQTRSFTVLIAPLIRYPWGGPAMPLRIEK